MPPISSLNPDVPPIVAAILDGALARDPSARLQTAGELVEYLDTAISAVDSGVGESDVRLLVALSQRGPQVPAKPEELGFAAMLEQEMDAFAEAGFHDLGSEALDPDEFDLGPMHFGRFKG